MNTFANAIKNVSTTTLTENGALTYSTSLDACVDLFFQIGAIRGQGAARVESAFRKAYAQNPDVATRIALFGRDVRGGAGERQVFRDVLKLLEKIDTDRLIRVLPLVPVVGRYDDLFIFETETAKNAAYSVFGRGLVDDETAGLAAKWAPRETGKRKLIARELMAFFDITERQYRKMIVSLSNTVEQKMSAKLWDEIEFQKVPSVAASRYAKAFRKQQPDRYNEFVQAAVKGEVKINASALFPYDLVKPGVDQETANAQWKVLPDYIPEGKSFIPMVDLSESMWGAGVGDAAVSLAIYLAERNKTAFNNMALAFADNPSWINIPKTDSLRDKVYAVRCGQVGYSTNIDAGFRQIVDTAVRNKIPPEDMPDYLIILSDMEFNPSYGGTNAQTAQRLFEQHGYKVPNLVWWNLSSRHGNTPVRANQHGMALVSGMSPAVSKAVFGGEVDPISVMLRAVNVEKYNH